MVILSSTTDSLYMAPMVAVGLEAGYASNVVALPVSTSPFQVKRNAFSSKGFNVTELTSDVKVIALAKNSFGLAEASGAAAAEDFAVTLNDADFNVTVQSQDKTTGKVTIADAEVVVSGGPERIFGKKGR